jgi:hypothetical protein
LAYLMSTEPTIQPPQEERRGQVLEVVRELLAQGLKEEVLALVAKLVARNTELEKQLAKGLWRGRKNEGVSSAQMHLLLEGLNEAPDEQRQEADRKLREASGFDTKDTPPEKSEKPKRQPTSRRPLPEHLRRVDNLIAVPQDQRPCPSCGTERECIGHDVTEVMELIPAEVIVRRDKREKLACTRCEGELNSFGEVAKDGRGQQRADELHPFFEHAGLSFSHFAEAV